MYLKCEGSLKWSGILFHVVIVLLCICNSENYYCFHMYIMGKKFGLDMLIRTIIKFMVKCYCRRFTYFKTLCLLSNLWTFECRNFLRLLGMLTCKIWNFWSLQDNIYSIYLLLFCLQNESFNICLVRYIIFSSWFIMKYTLFNKFIHLCTRRTILSNLYQLELFVVIKLLVTLSRFTHMMDYTRWVPWKCSRLLLIW